MYLLLSRKGAPSRALREGRGPRVTPEESRKAATAAKRNLLTSPGEGRGPCAGEENREDSKTQSDLASPGEGRGPGVIPAGSHKAATAAKKNFLTSPGEGRGLGVRQSHEGTKTRRTRTSPGEERGPCADQENREDSKTQSDLASPGEGRGPRVLAEESHKAATAAKKNFLTSPGEGRGLGVRQSHEGTKTRR
ncbi:MAG TPA: hypothetical protein VGM90_27575, partial [Kofleriaceae bacterium]